MDIIVRKPTEAEIEEMLTQPVWGCGVSEFDWVYDSTETSLIVKGDVTVTYEGGSVSFKAGDLCVFPKGLACVWNVKEPVEKHYLFS